MNTTNGWARRLPRGPVPSWPRSPRTSPSAGDVRIGVGVSIAAASVAAAVLLWQPDDGLAFMMFLFAAITLLVAPIVTVGMMVDVRRQKRSGGPLPPGPTPRRADQ